MLSEERQFQELLLDSEKDFASLPGLRTRRIVEGSVLGYTRWERWRDDFLYWHDRGTLGLYYVAPTPVTARNSRLQWIEKVDGFLPQRSSEGGIDGILLFQPRTMAGIPKEFMTCFSLPTTYGM